MSEDSLMESPTSFEEGPEPWKGALAGALAGAAGAFVMEKFQAMVLSKLASDGGGGAEEEPATVKAAEAVVRRELQGDEKKTAGEVAHYAMGMTSGAIYGVAAEYAPAVTMGHGSAFGAVVWAVADEGVVPLAGLSKEPTAYPLSTHASALASHLVYGLTVETVRGAVRKLL